MGWQHNICQKQHVHLFPVLISCPYLEPVRSIAPIRICVFVCLDAWMALLSPYSCTYDGTLLCVGNTLTESQETVTNLTCPQKSFYSFVSSNKSHSSYFQMHIIVISSAIQRCFLQLYAPRQVQTLPGNELLFDPPWFPRRSTSVTVSQGRSWTLRNFVMIRCSSPRTPYVSSGQPS